MDEEKVIALVALIIMAIVGIAITAIRQVYDPAAGTATGDGVMI